jgi:predicted metal-dependent HD superfamily phosphohydrolase
MTAHLSARDRDELLRRWSQPHRRHHNVAHLHEVLDVIAVLAGDGIAFDREAVELAAWFHDAVYEIGAEDNEDRSADLARTILATSPHRDEVARLVLTTKTHKPAAGDVDGAVFNPARAQVLSALPDGPIFHTDRARARWADRARHNIADEVAALTQIAQR